MSSQPRADSQPCADRYDPSRTWRWNLEHPPVLTNDTAVPEFPGEWNWCGLPVASPLGIAAGPLLNGGWLVAYARRGFDILVYKTVRTSPRDCYALPNLVPVAVDRLGAPGCELAASETMTGSWAVSFGMPSIAVEQWQADIHNAKGRLSRGQLLIVSVVGTQDETGRSGQLESDFAECARLAVAAGADGIEANFSCPNVLTEDGQLYQQPAAAARVASRVREAIGDVPLMLKIGHVATRDAADELLSAVAPFVDGLAMTNAIAATVRSASGKPLFDGQSRGICGDAIREASQAQVRLFAERIGDRGLDLQITGVGGISAWPHVRDYLRAGAATVAMATSAMVNPETAVAIRSACRDDPRWAAEIR